MKDNQDRLGGPEPVYRSSMRASRATDWLLFGLAAGRETAHQRHPWPIDATTWETFRDRPVRPLSHPSRRPIQVPR